MYTVSEEPNVNVNSPVVTNGIVVVTYREISTFHDYGGVVALSASSGALLWHQRLEPDPPNYFSGANSGPVVGNGVVVAANQDGRLHAYSLADGTPLWTAPRLDAFQGTQEIRYLATSGGLAIASSSTGILAAYALGDGAKQWEKSAGFGSTFGTLVASESYVFTNNYTGQLAILSLADGTVLWTLGYPSNGQSAPFWPYPLVDGKTLVVPGESGVFGFRLP
jgi:outer membrane protein assembly factor BamB